MATVVIDDLLDYVRCRGANVNVRQGLQNRGVWSSHFYRRWVLENDIDGECVHMRGLDAACSACWVLDRAHFGDPIVVVPNGNAVTTVGVVAPLIITWRRGTYGVR
jgi:hypothetical protein